MGKTTKYLKDAIEKVYQKTEKVVGSHESIRREQRDQMLGREIVGQDKHGNTYYQYYSYHGLPTRRLVTYNFFQQNKWHIDVHFQDWLFKRKALPPTPHELNQLYLEDEERMHNALEWDLQEEQAVLKEKYEKETEMLAGEEFVPATWGVDPQLPELKKYYPEPSFRENLQTLDQIVKQEHEDYQAARLKMNKEYNHIAFQEMQLERAGIAYDMEEHQMYNYKFADPRAQVRKPDYKPMSAESKQKLDAIRAKKEQLKQRVRADQETDDMVGAF